MLRPEHVGRVLRLSFWATEAVLNAAAGDLAYDAQDLDNHLRGLGQLDSR